jgi:hypothetical protein
MAMMTHLVAPAATVTLFSMLDVLVPYRLALKIHIERLPARYLPGGIWHTVGRMMDFYAVGIKPVQLTFFVVLENIVAAGVAAVLGGVSVGYFYSATLYWGQVALLVVIGSVIGLVVTPVILKKRVSAFVLSYCAYVRGMLFYVLVWLLYAVSFIGYLSVFPSVVEGIPLLAIGGVYLFSWAIGLVTFFAPQGIGVFEVIAGGLLSSAISLGSAVSLIAGFRVILLVADVSLWALVRGIRFSQYKYEARR